MSSPSVGAYVYPQAGVVELAPADPGVHVGHGTDISVEVGPTRFGTDLGDTRVRLVTEIGPTRAGTADVADTRTKWVVADSVHRNGVDVARTTRTATDIAVTRVQRKG